MEFGLIFLCGSALLCISSASISKTRLCVEYEISNYWTDEEAFFVILGVTQGRCMAQCVRQPVCRAFNFRPVDGSCRLLPEYLGCRTPNTTVGWLYVSLSTCSQRQPWQSTCPMESDWQWITSKNPAARTDTVGFSGRYLSRIFYKGVYLSSWWAPWPREIFRGVHPYDSMDVNCDVGEFLALLDAARFSWTAVNIDDPVPVNAVIGGYATDLAPLYVARRRVNGEKIPGFYNATSKMVVIVSNGYRVYTTGDLLLFLWRSWIIKSHLLTKWPPFRRRYFQTHFCEQFFFVFRFKFHISLFLRVQLTITQHWFR